MDDFTKPDLFSLAYPNCNCPRDTAGNQLHTSQCMMETGAAQSNRIQELEAALAMEPLVLTNRRFKAALREIKNTCGKVCEEYEICGHIACASSYKAWAIADAALVCDFINELKRKE